MPVGGRGAVRAATAPAILASTAVADAVAATGSTLPAVGTSATQIGSECVTFLRRFGLIFILRDFCV